MNKDYNKHKNIAIAVLTIIATILAACAYNKDNKSSGNVNTTDSCGINDAFYEINDVDTTNDGYSTDSVIYVDDNGNVIKSTLK